MLRRESEINGYAIRASDGQIGTVVDFLFDDENWLVRWLVVDTGNWLSGRKVLLPPSIAESVNHIEHQFAVKLTMQQVRDSPNIDTDRPVSRQLETSVYDHYGWSPYWAGGLYMGGYGYMGGYRYTGGAMGSSASRGDQRREQEIADAQRDRDDLHLRSIKEVTGYHIRASDGEIGHVDDFIVEDADWSIHYLVVDTKNWWPAKKVLVSPRSAEQINWAKKLVNLNVNRQTVKGSPAYDGTTTVDQDYENRFHKYYGDVRASDPV